MLIGINGYDGALPAAYQNGQMGGGCGCGSLGATYTVTAQPEGEKSRSTQITFPTEQFAADIAKGMSMQSYILTALFGVIVVGGVYLATRK